MNKQLQQQLIQQLEQLDGPIIWYSTSITYRMVEYDVSHVTNFTKASRQLVNTSNWITRRKNGMSAAFAKKFCVANFIFRNILERGILKGARTWWKIMEN